MQMDLLVYLHALQLLILSYILPRLPVLIFGYAYIVLLQARIVQFTRFQSFSWRSRNFPYQGPVTQTFPMPSLYPYAFYHH